MEQKHNLKMIKSLWTNRKQYKGDTVHLYLHSPFCVGICSYCMYNSIDMKYSNKEEYDLYFKSLVKQIDDFKDILNDIKIDSVYFGGGTPSIIPFNILEQISEIIPNWDRIPVKVFEANPVSMTNVKIDKLVELGYTYLSMGVQTLDIPELNRQNRKPPKNGHLKEITEYALNKGLHVNYDIMTLIGEEIKDDMERVYLDLDAIMKEYKPSSIDVYPKDQELNNVNNDEILEKISSLRRTLAKSLYFNKDYHLGGDRKRIDGGDVDNILKTYKSNYHLLNITDEEFGRKKVYSCSGPNSAPLDQNVISFGGHEGLHVYNYSSNRDFIYYSHIDKEGKPNYRIERSESKIG